MPHYSWNFSTIITYKTALLHGVFVTLELTGATLLMGTLLGLALALAKLSKNTLLSRSSAFIIEIFTGLPLLVLMIWLFYALPIFTGIKIAAVPTAIIALSLNLAGFTAEIFRAGIVAIPRGQTDAARSLGFSKRQLLQRIILPQAVRIVIPPLSGRYIETIKLTSLAAVIAVNELLHTAQNIISVSFRPLEVYSAIALLYLVIILPLTLGLRRLEHKQ